LAAGKNVLEVGSATGYSAVIMALAGARVTAVDSHTGDTWLGDTRAIMTENLKAFRVEDSVRIIGEMDTKALPLLSLQGELFDFIFIDAGGSYEEVAFDIKWALLLLEDCGTIAIHDYGHVDYPDKKKACDEFFPEGPTRLVHSLFVKTV
jgi:predicted O-methyltransferase YrrM